MHMKAKRLTVPLIALIGALQAQVSAQSVDLVVDQFDGTIGSAYGYKALPELPTANTEVTVDLDTMEGLIDWWFPAANGQGDNMNPPYYSKLGAEAISLESLVANAGGTWRANAGEPSIYSKFTDGELSLMPGFELASPEPSGWFGYSWYGNPNGGLENTLALRAEVGTKSVEFVHWLGNGSTSGTGQMNYTVTIYNAAGTELAQATQTVMKTDPLFLTVKASASGTSEGDYLVFRSDHTNTYWAGSFLRTAGDGGDGFELDVIGDWKLYTNPALGWIFGHTADWGWSPFLGSVYLPDFPSVYQPQAGWLYSLDMAPPVYWFYSDNLGYIYVVDSDAGWYRYSSDLVNYTWANFFQP